MPSPLACQQRLIPEAVVKSPLCVLLGQENVDRLRVSELYEREGTHTRSVMDQDLRVIDTAASRVTLSTRARSGDAPSAAMLIGDSVTYQGRRYVVVGFTPISVIPSEIQLRDPETGDTFWVERPPEPVERAALTIVPRRGRRKDN